jgi:hypothetical protein
MKRTEIQQMPTKIPDIKGSKARVRDSSGKPGAQRGLAAIARPKGARPKFDNNDG